MSTTNAQLEQDKALVSELVRVFLGLEWAQPTRELAKDDDDYGFMEDRHQQELKADFLERNLWDQIGTPTGYLYFGSGFGSILLKWEVDVAPRILILKAVIGGQREHPLPTPTFRNQLYRAFREAALEAGVTATEFDSVVWHPDRGM